MNNLAPGSTPNAPCSILHSASPADTTKQIMTKATDFERGDGPARKTILDSNSKLFITLGNDGNKKSFHVEDFAGLYPVWPIVEVAISPTGNAKEERMNMLVKCIMLLFSKILYINNTAGIAPLEITNNNEDNFIHDKLKLPSNFTRLGKWIMISGGSWVFSKKEKGSNDVYALFRLKSQTPIEEIIN
jgi:hypothetical protein